MIWIAIAACLVIAFTFSGIESGVLSVNRIRLRHHALRGEAGAVQLDALLTRIERLMITVVLLTNLGNILAVGLLYTEFTGRFGAVGALLALGVALPLLVFFVEFLPKAIFQRFPYRTLVIFARILWVADLVVGPLVEAGAALLRPIFHAAREPKSRRVAEVADIKRVIADAAARGDVAADASALIDRIIDFRVLRARDVMQPMARTLCVRTDTLVPEVLDLARKSGASRLPVLDESGKVAGILRVFDLLRDGVQTGRAQSYVRRAVAVETQENALETLRTLRAARMQLAIVRDDAGNDVGVVTSEDLVSRLLGGDG